MVGEYLLALWETWQGKMSGIASLILTAAATWSTFFAGSTGISRVRVYLWVAAGLCFLFANYKAWEKKAKLAGELESRLSDRRPKFIFSIGTTLWTYDQQRDLTAFFLSAEIINQGEPSIVSRWSATYSINTVSENMTPFYITEAYSLTVGKEVIRLTTADLLSAKTLSEQVPRGGHRSGRLLFTVPGNRTAQVESLQYRIDVTCHDYLSTPYTASYIPSPKPIVGGILHLPTEDVKPLQPLPSAAAASLQPPTKAGELPTVERAGGSALPSSEA
jgi:hypothetical protein